MTTDTTKLALALALALGCGPARDARDRDPPDPLYPPSAPAAPTGLATPAQVYIGRTVTVDIDARGDSVRVGRTRLLSDDPEITVLATQVLDTGHLRAVLRLSPVAAPEGAGDELRAPALGPHRLTLATPGRAEIAVPLQVAAPLAVEVEGVPSVPRLLQGGRARLRIRALDPELKLAEDATARVLTPGARLIGAHRVAEDRLDATVEADLDAPAAPALVVLPSASAAPQYLPGDAAGALRIAPRALRELEIGTDLADRMNAPGMSAVYRLPARGQAQVAILRLQSDLGGAALALLPASGRWGDARALRQGAAEEDGAVPHLAVLPAGQVSYPVVMLINQQDGLGGVGEALGYRLRAAAFPVRAEDAAVSEDPALPTKLAAALGTAYLPSQPRPRQAHYYTLRAPHSGPHLLAPAVAAQGGVSLQVREGGCGEDLGGKLRAESRADAPLLAVPLTLTAGADYCVAVRPLPGDASAHYSLLLTPAR